MQHKIYTQNIDVSLIRRKLQTIELIEKMDLLHVQQSSDQEVFFEAHVHLKSNISLFEMMNLRKVIEVLFQNMFNTEYLNLHLGYVRCNGQEKLIAQSLF